MFGLEFDLASFINAVAGGFLGALLTVPIALYFFRRSTRQAAEVFSIAHHSFRMAVNQLLPEGKGFRWLYDDEGAVSGAVIAPWSDETMRDTPQGQRHRELLDEDEKAGFEE